MFTAASVMMSGCSCPGTSMMKQWLIRRSVRMPPSRATTAPMSSSVWRLPFINASTRPAVTRPTAFAAESWLCADSTSSNPLMSRPASLACASNALRRGDEDRLDQAKLVGFDGAAQRDVVARVRDGHFDPGRTLRRGDQAPIFFAADRSGLRRPLSASLLKPSASRRAASRPGRPGSFPRWARVPVPPGAPAGRPAPRRTSGSPG